MKIAHFLVLLDVAFFYAPTAFSDSLVQLHSKEKLSQVPAHEVFQRDWSGFYTGLVWGGQFGRSSDTTADFGYNADNDQWNYKESGFNAGVELGYTYSLHQFAIGPEIELGYLGMKGSAPQPMSPGFDTIGNSNSDFYTAFRARVGVNLEHSLVFATAGAIRVNYAARVVDRCEIAPCGGSTVDAQRNSFVWGYIAGGGIEHWLNKGLSVKLEYLYFDLNSQSFSGATNFDNTYDWSGKTFGNIIRAGLNYHF